MHVPVPTERSFIGSERLFCWSHKCNHWLDNSRKNHIRSHFELTVEVQTMPTLLTRKMQSIYHARAPKRTCYTHHIPYTNACRDERRTTSCFRRTILITQTVTTLCLEYITPPTTTLFSSFNSVSKEGMKIVKNKAPR